MRSAALASGKWETMLAELIDNAFDAGAMNVRIVVEAGSPRGKDTEHGKISVVDDGDGCADVRVLASIGLREQHDRETSGRYGVGLKDASLWIGKDASSVEFSSVRDGKRRWLVVDWDLISKSNTWKIPSDAMGEEDAFPGERGTTVTLCRIGRKINFDSLATRVETFGYWYFSALSRGRTLSMQFGNRPPVACVPWQLPDMEHTCEAVVQVPRTGNPMDGFLTARVKAGIVPDDLPNPKHGLTYCHATRVIIPHSGNGLGAAPIARVCGIVEIGNEWDLAKNKNGFERSDELFEAVEGALEQLIKAAGAAAMKVPAGEALLHLGESLSDLFASDLQRIRNKKAKRRGIVRAAELPGVKPTGAGSPHRDAADKQAGNRMTGRGGGPCITVEFVPIEGDTVGHCTDDGRVMLNERNGTVAALRAGSKMDGTDPLSMMVFSLVAGWFADQESQLELGDEPRTRSQVMGAVLARITDRVAKP